MGKRQTIEEIKTKLETISPNIEILSDEYINNSIKLNCRCKIDGYEWETIWGSLRRGIGCPECSNCRHDYTIDFIKNKMSKINPNIEILSTEYKNNLTKLKCKCLIDNNIWYMSWDKLRQGQGCPECKKKMLHGGYNKTVAERNKDKWITKKVFIYFIECWNNEEHFYKIGITKRDIKQRFKGTRSMPYNYKLLKLIETNLYDAIYQEQELHKYHESFKYEPKIYFGGHSECFSLILDKI